ncbi:MAG: hypothetical protein AAFZ18_23995 [Myxococcota bacterium]
MDLGSSTLGRAFVVLSLLSGGRAWSQSERAAEPPRERSPVTASEARRGLPEVRGDCEQAELFGGTDIERSAFCALRKDEFVSARSLARAAVEAEAESFRAHYLLGAVQHRGEGNLPKALRHLDRAENLFAKAHGRSFGEDDPLRLLAYRILYELMDVHGEMDHHEARIRYAEAITKDLDIDHRASTAWPLMKLGRFEDARKVVLEALEADDRWSKAVALTSRCAIESEMRRREAAYEACRAAAEPSLQRGRGGSVELTNAGAASEEFFRFDEAERLYREAARRPPETSVNPWGRLVHLYLAEGRFAEALSAWREMRAYRARRPHAYLDQQDEAEARLVGAALMLVAGRPDLAEPVTRTIVERPDRQGTSSAASDQNEAGAALVARVARRARARRLEMEAAVSSWWQAAKLRAEAAQLRVEAWLVGRRALETLANPERLVTTLRPEVPGSLELPSWLDAEVIGLVGPGVAEVALERARSEETLPEGQAGVVFDAYAAEIAWWRGDYSEAESLAAAVLDRAPRGLTLVTTRAAAFGADAARRRGQYDAARSLFRAVVERDPAVLTRLGLALPVTFEAAKDTIAVEAVERLQNSPAFIEVPWGLILRVEPLGGSIRAADGSVLLEVPLVDADDDDEVRDPVKQLAQCIQQGVFGPLLDVTQVDVRSLEGGSGRGVSASDALDMWNEP